MSGSRGWIFRITKLTRLIATYMPPRWTKVSLSELYLLEGEESNTIQYEETALWEKATQSGVKMKNVYMQPSGLQDTTLPLLLLRAVKAI